MKLKAKNEEQRDRILSMLKDMGIGVIDDDEDGVYIDDFISFDDMAAIVDYLRTPEDRNPELFEECWKAYRRKGSKKKAKEYWNKLKDGEVDTVLAHIRAYVQSRDVQYQKDFERYLRDKTFTTVVFQGNQVLYDPSRVSSEESEQAAYMPSCGGALMWNDKLRIYIYTGFFDGRIADGYDDENRPDGVQVTLNNGRGTLQWSRASKSWNKV